ncbi:hypothetical protein [Aeromonas media]|uniref:hypothetical protein n=1 Tax=Aeromonas media TaxID=651 RepID=UPI00384E9FC1
MLFLVPLGAFASCPAGLHLQNVPIGTAMLYCVKWESSSLGGCEVGCSGVCVETPATGTMGPIYSSGVECSLGGGGDGGGGGDTGGSPGGDGSLPGDTDNIAGWQYFNHYGYETVGYTLSKINTNLGKQLTGVNSRLSGLKDFSNQIAGNTFKTQLELSGVNDRLNEALPYIKETSGRIEGTNLYLSRIEPQLEIANLHLKKLADAAGSGGGGSGEGGGGTSTYDELRQFHTDMVGANFAEYNSGASMYGQLSSMGYDILSMRDRVHTMASDVGNLYNYVLPDMRNNSIEMNRNVRDIAEAIKGGGGGTGGEGQGVDYSKMPGAADNPLHVAGAEYKSGLCQEGDNCAFDLGKINKKYDDKKAELKDKYGAIKDEVSQVFKFQFSGSASAPKCFDMFSLFGKSYSVCPEAEGYWETLAAIMMFIFYFIALMIVARR